MTMVTCNHGNVSFTLIILAHLQSTQLIPPPSAPQVVPPQVVPLSPNSHNTTPSEGSTVKYVTCVALSTVKLTWTVFFVGLSGLLSYIISIGYHPVHLPDEHIIC